MLDFSKSKIYKFIEQMPKIELHVHLEGSIQPDTLFRIAECNKIKLSDKNVKELEESLKFKNFQHFVNVYEVVTKCLKTVDDYELISYEFGRQCSKQNILYAEVTFSIFTNCKLTGLPWQDIVRALNRGREKAVRDFGINWNWVFDILRDDLDSQKFVLDVVFNSKNENVVALGLTGDEKLFNTNDFVETFQDAHKNNMAITVHAGEMAGPKSIWDAIKLLNSDRIGHGVTCIQDPELIEFLKQKQIPLEICLTSNICMGVFLNFKAHPFRSLWDSGLFLTINSDDPALFDTDLNNEYKILVDHFDFDINDLEKISLNGVHASFLPTDQKQKLDKLFKAEFVKLRKELGI